MAKNKKHRQIKKLKKNTAVTFDANERQNYLKANIGAKKRRREFYLKKMENQKKEQRQQEKAQLKAQRREELSKAKQLLQKLSNKVEDNYRAIHEPKEKNKVQVNKANNLIVQTKFY